MLTFNESTTLDLGRRLRRNRKSPAMRALLQENHLQAEQLVVPLFVLEQGKEALPINSMPGIYRLPLPFLIEEVQSLYKLGIRAVDLFPVIDPAKKDGNGTEALNENGIVFQAVRALKREIPDMCVMVDVALDPFTAHGHDGIVNAEGQILNDETVVALAKMCIVAAEAGADVVAPSDMMDGRVAFIRRELDRANFQDVSICSYAAKYASAFYGPFREALGSSPKFGDKKTYQMNPANKREAVLECLQDVEEGADMLLIKPGLPYLDVIAEVRAHTNVPVGAYHVSGEYAMVMAAAQNGWVDADKVFLESLLAMKRAGADFIFTYAAKRVLGLLKV